MKRVLTLLVGILAVVWLMPAWASDTVYYYYTDSLHSAVAMTDAQGNVLERTYYAPYGQVLNRDLRDGPGYTGHEEDPETSLVYMQQRYYDPEAGRFLSTDPVQADGVGGSFNRYEYANDNPYRYTDPDGRETGIAFHSEFVMMGAQAQTYQAPGDWLGPALQAAFASLPVLGPAFGVLNAAANPTTGNVALAVAGVLPAGRLAGDAIKEASAADRATALAGTMGARTQEKVTIAVTETSEGTRVVSSSEGALRPATRAAMGDGEVAGRGSASTHAEVNGVNAARQMGLTPTGTAASRPICPSCTQFLEQQKIKPLSPLKQ